MSTLRQYRFLLTAVERGSLTGAAQALDVSVAAVSKQIRALEEATDSQLLNRTTQGVRPTELGRRFVRHCRDVLERIAEAERSLHADKTAMRGRIAITLSRSMAIPALYEALAAFSRQHPAILFDVVIDESLQNLQDDDIDFALRVGRVDDTSGVVALPIRRVRPVLCAAPSYLEHLDQSGEPPAWMATMPITLTPAVRRQLRRWGIDLTARPSHRASDLQSVQAALRAGLCMGVLLDVEIADAIAAGSLVAVRPDDPLPSKRLYLLYSRDRPMLERHERFKTFLVERLKAF